MNSPRSILFIAFLVVSFFLYQNWLIDTAPPGTQQVTPTQPPAMESGVPVAQGSSIDAGASFVPEATSSHSPATPSATRSQTVRVTTDVLDIVIDTHGGDVINAQLLHFARTHNSAERFELLHSDPNQLYIAQSGLVGTHGTDSAEGRPVFHVEQSSYQMAGDTLEVPLHYSANGIEYTKTFIFTAGSYAVDVVYTINNHTNEHKQMQFYAQLKQVMSDGSGNMMMPTYKGGAYSWDQDRYEKYSFDDMRDARLNHATDEGWVAMLEHYFVSAWIPRTQGTKQLFSRVVNGDQAIMGLMYPVAMVAPGATAEIRATLFIGPKDQDAMAKVAKYLDLTVDYGFLWWLAQPIFKLLQLVQSVLVNWGLSIIAITIIIKILLYPLTKKQYVSMAKMRMIQPKMQALRERYGDDRQKMSQAMMKLYKDEKVNPLGGCLPMLLQLPIFLALYWVLLESVELRHAPLFLWIDDLSARDPYFVLPILMGASMFIMQKLQPTPATDPMQQKMLQYMPVIFTVFFLWFPAGLVLYWLSSNLITIGQMQWIYRGLEKQGLMDRRKK